MIGIINYGVGNIQSVKNSLDFLSIPNGIINSPKEIKNFDKIILPGVGAFGAAMKKLNDLGFVGEIKKFSKNKPILGICLGMQLLFEESSEYGKHKGLGLIKGKVLNFNKKVKKLPIPLIGWTEIKKTAESPLLLGLDNEASFYSVHSYYCEPAVKSVILATSNYGIDFPAIVGKNKVFGCQFHPEKSQKAGLQILKNFQNL
jgi:glutamine amidotransferase